MLENNTNTWYLDTSWKNWIMKQFILILACKTLRNIFQDGGQIQTSSIKHMV